MQRKTARLITNIDVNISTGIYAPVSMNGVLLVDGVVVSAYVEGLQGRWTLQYSSQSGHVPHSDLARKRLTVR